MEGSREGYMLFHTTRVEKSSTDFCRVVTSEARHSSLSSENFVKFYRALLKYRATIEKKPSSSVQDVFGDSLMNAISDAQTIKREWEEDSLTAKAMRKLLPILDILERYSPIIDIMVQGNPSPGSLVWGGIKLLLRVCLLS